MTTPREAQARPPSPSNGSNTGLNIHVDEKPTGVYPSSTATYACSFFVFVPGVLLAFFAGVGGALLWVHRAGSIARRNIPS